VYLLFFSLNGENTISLCVCRGKSDQVSERPYSVLRHSDIFSKLVSSLIIFLSTNHIVRGHAVVHLVEAVRCKTEGPGVDSASNIN
jgi:hypothetical protein